MKIVCLHLSSGEELICRLVENVQGAMLMGSSLSAGASPLTGPEPWHIPQQDLIVENVNTVGIHDMGKGQVGIGFTPWAVGNQAGTFRINATHITAVYSPSPELEKGFIQQTTGIAMPGTGPTTRM